MKVSVLTYPDFNYEVGLFGLGLSYGKTSDLSFKQFLESTTDYNSPYMSMARVANKLKHLGNGHNKFLRAITIHLDITAPLYWWKQFDTYKVGTVTQSESTMHTLLKRPITRKSFEQGEKMPIIWIWYLERLRRKKDFTRLNLFLPNSWLQRRIVTLNYEVINNIIRQRYHHKLPEWQYFCERIWQDANYQSLIVQKDDLNSKHE